MRSLQLSGTKQDVYNEVSGFIEKLGFRIITSDLSRPWGGFLVLDEDQASKFSETFFPEIEFASFGHGKKLSPKILMVAPEKKLSWQYHHRRSEVWKLIGGEAGIVRSDSDAQGPLEVMNVDEIVRLRNGERHRLVGLKTWGIVAEIWQHTDPANPSDEEDIVRLADDFGR